MQVKLIIFDMDGVLVDSKKLWYSAWKVTWKTVGKEMSYEDYSDKCWGTSFHTICELGGIKEQDIGKAQEILLDTYSKNYLKVEAFPGVNELFSKLEEMGIKKALLTNAPKYISKMVMDKMGLKFDSMPDLFNIAPKPDPIGVFTILEELGINKDEAIFVGDTDTDEEAGKRAGVRTIIVGKNVDKTTDVLKQI